MWGEMSLGKISLWRVVLIPISTADVSVHHQLSYKLAGNLDVVRFAHSRR